MPPSFYLFVIAKRIFFNKKNKKKVLSPSSFVAIINMALGLTVMILSVAVVVGFKKEVQSKIIGFISHIQITNIKNKNACDTYPMIAPPILLNELKSIPNIHHIQRFIIKPAIVKITNKFHGILLKGVDENFDWTFFKKNLTAGNLIKQTSDCSVLLSKKIAEKLHFRTNDNFLCYFIQDPIRVRKYHISGIYQTNFIDYDQLFVLCNIKQILRLNNWGKDMVSGLEIFVDDYNSLEKTMRTIRKKCSALTNKLNDHYAIRSIKQINPAIFLWFGTLTANVVVILILTLLVAGFSMASGLLTIILEHTSMIGILKTMGEKSSNICKIFLYLSIFLIGKGMLWGNIIAILIYFVQKYGSIFKLNPNIYFVSEVSLYLSFFHWILINVGTFFLTLLIMIVPSCVINKMSPAIIIRF